MQSGMQSGMQSVPCEFVFRGLPRADVDRLCALTRGVDKEVAAADARVKSRLQQVQAQAAEAAKAAASAQAAEAAKAQAATNKAAAATREVDAYRGLPAYMQGITARMQAVTGALGAAAAALEQRSVPVQAPPPFQAPPRQAQGWAKYQGNIEFPAAESNVENMLARRRDPAYEVVRTTPQLQQTQAEISQMPKGDPLRNATVRVLREGVMTPGTIPIINRELEGQQRRQAEAAARPAYMDQLGNCSKNLDERQRKECILNVLKAVAEMETLPDDNTVAAVKGVLSTITPYDEGAKVLLQTVLAASGQEFQQALKELVSALSTETMDVDQDPVGDLFKLSVGNTVDQELDTVVEFTNAAMWLFTEQMLDVDYARIIPRLPFGAAKLFAMYYKNWLVRGWVGDDLDSYMAAIRNDEAASRELQNWLRDKLSEMLPQYIEAVKRSAAANVSTGYLLETVSVVQRAFPQNPGLQQLRVALETSVAVEEQKKTAPNPFAGLTPQVPPPFPPPPPSIPVAQSSIFATAAPLTPLQQEIVDYARATANFAPARKVEGTARQVALELYNMYMRNQGVFNNTLLEKEIHGLKDADANGKANMVENIVNALDGRLLSRHLGNLIQYLTETQGDQAVKDAQHSLTHTNSEDLLRLATANVFRDDLIPRLAALKDLVDTGLQMSMPLQQPEPARSIFVPGTALSEQEQQIVDFSYAAYMAANDTDTPSAKWNLYQDDFTTNAVVRGMLTSDQLAAVDGGTLTDVQKADIINRISVAIYFAPLNEYLDNLGAMVPNTVSRPDVLTSLNLVKALQDQAKPGLSWDGLVAAVSAQPFNVDTFQAQLQVLKSQAKAQQEALNAAMDALNQPRAPEAPIQPVVYTPPNVPGDAPDTIKDYAEAAHFFYRGVTEAVLGNRGALMQFLREHTVDYAALLRLMPDLYSSLQEAIRVEKFDSVKAVVKQIREQLNGGDLIAFIDALIYYANPNSADRVPVVRELVKAVEGVGLTPELQAFADGAAVTPTQLVSDLQQWRRNKTRPVMPPRHNQADIQDAAKKYMDAYALAAEALADMTDDKDDYAYFRFLEYRKGMFQDNAVFKEVKDAMPPNFQGVLSDKQYVADQASLYKSVVMNLQERVWKAPLEAYLTQLIAYLGASPAPATLQTAIKNIRDATAGVPILYTIDRAMKQEQVTGNDLKEAIEGVRNDVRAPQWMSGNDKKLRQEQGRYKSSIPVQPREPVQWTGMFSLSGAPVTLEGKQVRDYVLAAVFFLPNDPITNWELFSKQLAERRRKYPSNTVVNENLKDNDQTAVNEFIQKLKGSLLVDFLNNLAKWAEKKFDAQKAANVQAALRMALLPNPPPDVQALMDTQVTPEGLGAFKGQVVDTLKGYAAQLRQALQAAKSVPVDDGTRERLSFVINFGVAAWILFTSDYSPADKLSELWKIVEGKSMFNKMMPVFGLLASDEDKINKAQNVMYGPLLTDYLDAAIRLAHSQDMNVQRELLASLQLVDQAGVVQIPEARFADMKVVNMDTLREKLEDAKENAQDDEDVLDVWADIGI